VTAAGPEAPPAPPPARLRPPSVPVRATVGRAFRIALRQPRVSLLPLAAVQAPAALVAAVATAVLFLTVFKNDPVDPTEGGPLLAFLIIAAAQGLFAQVAHAATIVSIAGAETGRPRTLSESLDPAFSRMGAILGLVAILALGALVCVFSLVGVVLLPYLGLRVILCFETMMLENVGPWAAIRRSWALTHGHVLRLLGVVALSALVVVGPVVGLEALGLISGNGHTSDVLIVSAVTFVQGVLAIPLVSFLTATTTLFYLQVRALANARPAA
jgi:Membrane domain of glycerophosphoryl diester phosphodiesterase